jgi:hypothetical protein
MRVVLAIDPRGPNSRQVLERCSYSVQGRAAHGLVLRTAHGDAMRGDQHNLIIGHRTTRRLALTPEK